MQKPDGSMKPFHTLEEAERESRELSQRTKKPHPVFTKGEVLEIKGGRFRVHQIFKDRLILRPMRY